MFTVSDLYNLPLLSSANILTNSSGFSLPIEGTGILDHECNSSKISEEFYPMNLVLSNLLLVKDSPDKVVYAIKGLVDANISCIGICDLYLTSIPDVAIQYAIEKDVSIFFFSKDISFEEIIITVFDHIHSDDNNILASEQSISNLMKYCEDDDKIKNIVTSMKLLLKDEISVIYIISKNGLSITEYNMTVNALNFHPFFSNSSTVLHKRNEFAIILSSSPDKDNSRMNLLLDDFLSLSNKRNDIHIGISDKSNDSSDLGLLMQQAFDACQHAALTKRKYMKFKDLGIFAALYPMSRTKRGSLYIKNNLFPLIGDSSSDNKRNKLLLETLKHYIDNDRNIKNTAYAMNQHENTVRYRIKQITELLDIDKFSNSDWLKIELALYLYFIKNNS